MRLQVMTLNIKYQLLTMNEKSPHDLLEYCLRVNHKCDRVIWCVVVAGYESREGHTALWPLEAVNGYFSCFRIVQVVIRVVTTCK